MWFLYPHMMTFWFFIMLMFSCVSSILNPSSHNFPSGMSAMYFRYGKVCAIFLRLVLWEYWSVFFHRFYFPCLGGILKFLPRFLFFSFWDGFWCNLDICAQIHDNFIWLIHVGFRWYWKLIFLVVNMDYNTYFIYFIFYFSLGQPGKILEKYIVLPKFWLRQVA